MSLSLSPYYDTMMTWMYQCCRHTLSFSFHFILHPHSANNPSESTGTGLQGSEIYHTLSLWHIGYGDVESRSQLLVKMVCKSCCWLHTHSVMFILHPHSASNPSESAGTGLQGRQHWALIRIAIHYDCTVHGSKWYSNFWQHPYAFQWHVGICYFMTAITSTVTLAHARWGLITYYVLVLENNNTMCYEVLAKACCRCVNISLCWSSGKDSRTATSLSGSGDLQWGNGRGGGGTAVVFTCRKWSSRH